MPDPVCKREGCSAQPHRIYAGHCSVYCRDVAEADAEIAALNATMMAQAQTDGLDLLALREKVDALKAEKEKLHAKIARLIEAGDALTVFRSSHTHGMMGRRAEHRCDRCDMVDAWEAAKKEAE